MRRSRITINIDAGKEYKLRNGSSGLTLVRLNELARHQYQLINLFTVIVKHHEDTE